MLCFHNNKGTLYDGDLTWFVEDTISASVKTSFSANTNNIITVYIIINTESNNIIIQSPTLKKVLPGETDRPYPDPWTQGSAKLWTFFFRISHFCDFSCEKRCAEIHKTAPLTHCACIKMFNTGS